ncbi:MAG: (2Fe-2S)-binding protein [Deltaproteobacteria bacterium]|nr:(2Fe-2S)-binding protein [Deltaproteobacteria bacterium]
MNEARSIRTIVNGKPLEISVSPNETLLEFLRYRLGLTGTKEGCDTGDCGACTVLLEGKPVNACLVLAVEADGGTLATIEGLSSNGELHPLQQAFIDQGAVQCGFCTPGMIMAAKSLLDEEPSPSEEEIRLALAGNICRCTGYVNIMKAVTAAGQRLRGSKQG